MSNDPVSFISLKSIYSRYHLPALLQAHLCRTASLMELILKHWQGPAVNHELLIEVMLLHDLGNLVKFDLTETTPMMLFSAEELSVYQPLQAEWHQKYGTQVDQVTVQLIQELRLKNTSEITALVLKQASTQSTWEPKLCHYADMRIAPQGLVTLADRFADLGKRYSQRDAGLSTPTKVAERLAKLETIEQELQLNINLNLQTIAAVDLEPIERWQDYHFSVTPE